MHNKEQKEKRSQRRECKTVQGYRCAKVKKINAMFTEDYFSQNIPSWDALFSVWEPKRILEIGSFEGRSTSYWIERLKDEPSGEIHCVDTWLGGEEHNEENIQMSTVERILRIILIRQLESTMRNAKCSHIKG